MTFLDLHSEYRCRCAKIDIDIDISLKNMVDRIDGYILYAKLYLRLHKATRNQIGAINPPHIN